MDRNLFKIHSTRFYDVIPKAIHSMCYENNRLALSRYISSFLTSFLFTRYCKTSFQLCSLDRTIVSKYGAWNTHPTLKDKYQDQSMEVR